MDTKGRRRPIDTQRTSFEASSVRLRIAGNRVSVIGRTGNSMGLVIGWTAEEGPIPESSGTVDFHWPADNLRPITKYQTDLVGNADGYL